MDMPLVVAIILGLLVVVMVLARMTNLFKVAPGQEINWGKLLKDSFQYLLASLIVLGFFMVVWFVLNKALPAENQRVADIIFGALIANFNNVVNYFFGSSKGSQAKDDTIAKIADQP